MRDGQGEEGKGQRMGNEGKKRKSRGEMGWEVTAKEEKVEQLFLNVSPSDWEALENARLGWDDMT
jgi:hypothetical protein